MEELDIRHKNLRMYRYYYYVLSKSLVSDYVYDNLEKEYIILCDELKISQEVRISNFIGFNIRIPMSLLNKEK